MAWRITSASVRESMLGAINTALGTAAKISWRTAADQEVGSTTLYASGTPFTVGTPAGSMSMTLTGGSGYLSGLFSGGSCTQAWFTTSGNAEIMRGTFGATSGYDINADAVPASGQQLRLDTLVLSIQNT